MKRLTYLLVGVLFIACQSTTDTDADTTPVNYLAEPKEDFDARMEWWRDAGFGMFIHWGAYAVPAGVHNGEPVDGIGEWIMNHAQIPVAEYEKYVATFNPVQFDAKEWATIAKNAGMEYMVITSKHHDGFCLWDSEVTDYDIMDASPYGKDILADLSAACKEVGIKLGFYHSIMDWHHPDAQAPHYPTYNTGDKSNPNFDNYRTTYLKPQVAELIKKYDPYILWYDGEWIPEWTHEYGQDLYQFTREQKPSILVNNRVDKGRQGMQGMDKTDKDYAGDFGTPEQEILDGTADVDWESCMTMNDTWAFKTNDDNWKSTATLIHNLVDIAAKGGNYLLNVGPTAEGLIPAPSVKRLAAIGDWMQINGEIIHQSRGTKDFKEGETIRYIQSNDGKTQYIASLSESVDPLKLTKINISNDGQVSLLGYDGDIDWSQKDGEVVINFPKAWEDASARPCQHAFVFKIN